MLEQNNLFFIRTSEQTAHFCCYVEMISCCCCCCWRRRRWWYGCTEWASWLAVWACILRLVSAWTRHQWHLLVHDACKQLDLPQQTDLPYAAVYVYSEATK